MTPLEWKEFNECLRLMGRTRFEEAQEIVDAQKKQEEQHG